MHIKLTFVPVISDDSMRVLTNSSIIYYFSVNIKYNNDYYIKLVNLYLSMNTRFQL